MLHTLLLILKIIGITIIAILGILVLLLCVVLFVPVCYRGKAKADGTVESIQADIRFSWLLHLVGGYVKYEHRKLDWQIRIGWKKVNIEKGSSVPTEEDVPEDGLAKEDIPEQLIAEEQIAEERLEETIPVESEMQEEINSSQEENVSKDSTIRKWIQKIKCTFQTICDKIRVVQEKKDEIVAFIEDEIHQQFFKRIKIELLRLLRFMRPKKMRANVRFGFEDPYKTGKVLAILSMMYPFYGRHITIQPEFEETVLAGDLYIKGKFRCVYLVIVCIHLIFDKNVRMTYKELKNGKTKK